MKKTLIKNIVNIEQKVFIDKETSLNDILEILSNNNFSAVIITKDKKPVGIITERDILRACEEWDKFSDYTAMGFMHSPLITVHESLYLNEAYSTMSCHNIRHLIVINNKGEAIGLVEENDFISYLSSEEVLMIKEVEKIMTRKVVKVSTDATINQALHLMNQFKISSVVVMENHLPIGILTEGDSVKLAKFGKSIFEESVKNYMSELLITVQRDCPITEAEKTMRDHGVKRLVVVNKLHQLVGIVTQHDFVHGMPQSYVSMLRETIKKQNSIIQIHNEKLNERAILENIVDVIPNHMLIAANYNGVVFFSSSQCCCKRGDLPLIGDSVYDFTHLPSFELISRENLDKVYEGEVLQKEVHIASEGGCYLNTTLLPINEHENELGFLLFVHDQTEIIKTRKALEESVKNYDTLFENTAFGVLIIDEERHKLVGCNELASRLFSIDRDNLESWNVGILHRQLTPEEYDVHKKTVRERGNDSYLISLTFGENDKRHIIIVCRGIDYYGRFCHQSILVDVTEQVETQRALAKSEARYRELFESSQAIELIIDPNDGIIINTNKAARNFYGFNAQTFKHLYIYDLNIAKKEDVLGNMKNALLKKQSRFEFVHRLASGEYRDVEVYSGPIASEAGVLLYSIIFDITEKKELEKELKEKQEMMMAQSRHAAMGEMISMIAHQWRQPLATISMASNNVMADIELDTLEVGELKQQLETINEMTQHLTQTIEDFRNFFKPKKEKSFVSVESIMEDVFKIMGKSLENNNIHVLYHFEAHSKVQTYVRELLQVFINIIKNAKEALIEKRVEERRIKIAIKESERDVIVFIGDNAGGIDKEVIGHVFEPYFTTKDDTVGTGLGLYMSKTIVEKHLKGKLEVKNRKEGACFSISLPKGVSNG